jgi:hypothetical protein
VAIDDIIQHEEFNRGPRLNNDIAIIRIRAPGVYFTDFVQPVCVVPRETIYSPELNCTISGWGAKGSASSGPSRFLRAGVVHPIPDQTCRSDQVTKTYLLNKMSFL